MSEISVDIIEEIADSFKINNDTNAWDYYFNNKYNINIYELENSINNSIDNTIVKNSIFHIAPIITILTLFFNIVIYTFNR